VRELKSPSTLYTQVHTIDLIDHLQDTCKGLNALDLLELQNEMQGYHLKAKGIPEYINALEDAKKRSKRVAPCKPITDGTLLMFATNDMLSTEQFQRANETW